VSLKFVNYINYIQEVYLYQLGILEKAIFERLLPAFANIEAESKVVEQNEWQRLGSMPGTGDEDPADLAEAAFGAGLAHHEAAIAARQIMINTMATTLHHLFEQQVIAFCRHELLDNKKKENLYTTFDWREAIVRVKDSLQIDCEKFSSYSRITELRRLGSAIKHADGRSADELRRMRPEMFIHPALREDKRIIPPTHLPIYMPLAGQDLFVTEADLKEYFNAVREFWNDMMSPFYGQMAEYLQRR
jgi:hypothetical protein